MGTGREDEEERGNESSTSLRHAVWLLTRLQVKSFINTAPNTFYERKYSDEIGLFGGETMFCKFAERKASSSHHGRTEKATWLHARRRVFPPPP